VRHAAAGRWLSGLDDSGCLPSLASPGVHARAVACEERNELSDCLVGELRVSKDDMTCPARNQMLTMHITEQEIELIYLAIVSKISA